MRKKSGFTIVEQAIVLVPEFKTVVQKLERQVTLRGQSKSTLHNYIRRIALFVIHFGKLPERIDPEEINEFLAGLARGQHDPKYARHKPVQGGQYHRNIQLKQITALLFPIILYSCSHFYRIQFPISPCFHFRGTCLLFHTRMLHFAILIVL